MNTQALKAKMVEKSVTQSQIAKVLGCTQAAVSQKLTYARRLKIEEAAVIADILNMTNEEIVDIFFDT